MGHLPPGGAKWQVISPPGHPSTSTYCISIFVKNICQDVSVQIYSSQQENPHLPQCPNKVDLLDVTLMCDDGFKQVVAC